MPKGPVGGSGQNHLNTPVGGVVIPSRSAVGGFVLRFPSDVRSVLAPNVHGSGAAHILPPGTGGCAPVVTGKSCHVIESDCNGGSVVMSTYDDGKDHGMRPGLVA